MRDVIVTVNCCGRITQMIIPEHASVAVVYFSIDDEFDGSVATGMIKARYLREGMVLDRDTVITAVSISPK